VKRLLGISGLTIILSLMIYLSFPGRYIDMKAYDIYSCARGYLLPPEDIVIVGIDEESFSMINLPWPWPRNIHGQLIRALMDSGARGIIIDIIFSDSSIPKEDKVMIEAIRQYGKVTLAADIETVKTEKFTQEMLVTPLDEFLRAGALFGVSSIPVDSDNVVRRVFWGTPEVPSLEVAALKMLGISRAKDYRKMVHFAGPAFHIPYVPYYRVLQPDLYLPDGFFKNKVVLVGKYSHPSQKLSSDPAGKYRLRLQPPSPVRGVDMFATPFYIMDNKLTQGIEIHANMLSSLIRDDHVKPLRVLEAVGVIILLSLLLTLMNSKWTPVKSISLNAFLAGVYLLISYFLFNSQGIFLPFTAPLIAIFTNFIAAGVMSYVGVEKKRRYLRRAFSLYLSPQVAKKVIEDPERLKLGGQRINTTVLFSDLAGFTEISEKNEPEEVVSLLTRYTTEMTKIIFKYNGTLDKFIGDAIMAVWGTPVEDKDHALHACLASLEMQRKAKILAEEITIPGYRLFMRIGINTGVVMAGNMGSEERFDFTVIGDNVNTAARLETLNKIYGTEIIITESTLASIVKELSVRELDSVRVKGKRQVIKIYELIDGERNPCIDFYEKGLQLYRKGHFEAALGMLYKALDVNPEDRPCKVLINRCNYLLKYPPQEEWTGVRDFGTET